MSAAQLFIDAPLVVCLTPGLLPSAAPYRIPQPGNAAGLNLKTSDSEEIARWLADAAKRQVSIRYDGEAFLLWGHIHQDIARIEANWTVLAALWGLIVPPPRPGPVIDEELAAHCWHAWHTTKSLISRQKQSTAEEKENDDQDNLFGERETPIPEDSDLVFADVEHTGGRPEEGARVCQIALTRVEQKTGFVDEFSSLVNPEGVESDYWAYKTHGLSKWQLAKAPLFSRLLPRVLKLLNGAVFIAHNGKATDVPFIKNELRRVEAEWPCLAQIDTLAVARKLFPHFAARKGGTGHKLGALASVFVVEQGIAHDAKGDVQTLMGVWGEMRRRHPKVTLTEMARY